MSKDSTFRRCGLAESGYLTRPVLRAEVFLYNVSGAKPDPGMRDRCKVRKPGRVLALGLFLLPPQTSLSVPRMQSRSHPGFVLKLVALKVG